MVAPKAPSHPTTRVGNVLIAVEANIELAMDLRAHTARLAAQGTVEVGDIGLA